MGHGVSQVAARSATLVVGALGLCAVAWRLTRDDVLGVGGRIAGGGPGVLAELPFDEVLTALCSVALLVCASWLVAVTSLVGLEAVAQAAAQPSAPATWARERLCPGTLRRVLLAGCGIALVSGLVTTTAYADAAGAVDPGALVSGLRLPDRAVGAPELGGRGASTSRSRSAPGLVEVSAGDSLWSLAQQVLGGRPTDPETTAAWRAIYLANVDRIGTDPDLIFPGTTLHLPDLDPSRRKEPS
jgi:hypothetical protein